MEWEFLSGCIAYLYLFLDVKKNEWPLYNDPLDKVLKFSGLWVLDTIALSKIMYHNELGNKKD